MASIPAFRPQLPNLLREAFPARNGRELRSPALDVKPIEFRPLPASHGPRILNVARPTRFNSCETLASRGPKSGHGREAIERPGHSEIRLQVLPPIFAKLRIELVGFRPKRLEDGQRFPIAEIAEYLAPIAHFEFGQAISFVNHALPHPMLPGTELNSSIPSPTSARSRTKQEELPGAQTLAAARIELQVEKWYPNGCHATMKDDLPLAARTLRDARQRSGLSLGAAAKRAGTSHSTLPAYAYGSRMPSLNSLSRILEALGFA